MKLEQLIVNKISFFLGLQLLSWIVFYVVSLQSVLVVASNFILVLN